jgi:hypothetical protein
MYKLIPKVKKQRFVVITYENTAVYKEVGDYSVTFKLHANRIVRYEFHTQREWYASLLPVYILILNTANVIVGIVYFIKVFISMGSVCTQVRSSSQ